MADVISAVEEVSVAAAEGSSSRPEATASPADAAIRLRARFAAAADGSIAGAAGLATASRPTSHYTAPHVTATGGPSAPE